MGLSEFHDTLLLIILHFSSNISDGRLWVEISLIRHPCFPSFDFFYNRLYLHSHQGLVIIGLLDNFLDPRKVFPVRGKRFCKITEQCYDDRMAGGKERKMNGRSATANQVRDCEKRLKQKFLQMDSAMKNI
jgi:hypothetical protein